jgi:hypothetical protein
VRIQALSTQAGTIREVRELVYDNLTKRLDAMVLRLQNNQIDAAKLETANTELDAKIAEFFTDFDSYQSALEDAGAMDCQTDPSGFFVALQDARMQRKDLITEAKAIRMFVRDNIRKVFAEVKKSIKTEEAKPEEETTTEVPAGTVEETN